MVKATNRSQLHKACKEALSFNKCVIFAAVLDSYGKIIAAEWNKSAKYRNENEYNSSTFYQDHLLPVITSMTSYSNDRGTNKICPRIHSQLLKVGLRNRISVAYLDGTSTNCHFLVVYWKV